MKLVLCYAEGPLPYESLVVTLVWSPGVHPLPRQLTPTHICPPLRAVQPSRGWI